MFVEFDKENLEKWIKLTDKEKQNNLNNNEVDLVVDISIKIQNHEKTVEKTDEIFQIIEHMDIIINRTSYINSDADKTSFMILFQAYA